MPNSVPTHKAHGDVRKMYDAARGTAHQRGYGSLWHKRIRTAVLRRDHYLCRRCQQPVGHSGAVHHLVPKSEGGTNELSNLVTLCSRCHNQEHKRA